LVSFAGAEVCELVGLYLLNKLSNIIATEHIEIYRDDALAILPNLPGLETERQKKNSNSFPETRMNITIEAGM